MTIACLVLKLAKFISLGLIKTTPTLIYLVWGVAQHHRCNLLEQSNSHLNLAYQLLQAQHPLKSARKLCFSFILQTSPSPSQELARKQVYTSHTSTCMQLLSPFAFFQSTLTWANFKVTSKGEHLNQSTEYLTVEENLYLNNIICLCLLLYTICHMYLETAVSS